MKEIKERRVGMEKKKGRGKIENEAWKKGTKR